MRRLAVSNTLLFKAQASALHAHHHALAVPRNREHLIMVVAQLVCKVPRTAGARRTANVRGNKA